MYITANSINRTFGTVIAAILFAGAVAAAPPATAVNRVPEPETTTPTTTFDIGEWVAERKARMAQDLAQRTQNLAAAVKADDKETGEFVAQAKGRAAQAYIDRAVPPK